jgi:hypothetical protein
MDETAEKLLKQLEGAGTRQTEAPSSPSAAEQIPFQSVQDGEHDRWRILLVELAYLLNASFRDVHYWEGVKAEKDTFRQLVKILDELDQMPVPDGMVRITLRGARNPKISENADYVIQYGDITVDMPAIISLINRMGIRLKHLEGRLVKSFEAFADQGFSTLLLKLPGENQEELDNLQVSLRVISCFNQAIDKNSPIVFVKDDNQYSLYPILDELNQPDPNLTMVAAVNNLNQSAMMELVQKVSAITQKKTSVSNVFQILFKIKSLRQRLVKPPLEVNTDKTPAAVGGQKGSAQLGRDDRAAEGTLSVPAHPEMDQTVLKEGVARFVKGTFRNSPQAATQVMKSIYAKDYKGINPNGLGKRFKLITALLNTMQKSPKAQNIAGEVLKRMQASVDQVSGEILNDFVIQDEELKFWSDGAEINVGKIDKNLLKIIDSSKTRSGVKRKAKILLSAEKKFTPQDFESIAEDFDISSQVAEEIIRLIKSCYDAQGNFSKPAFEKNVPAFARYEKKVFEILWEFLKEIPRRSDRLPFLNSLQLLVREIKKPIQAIKVLLADFIRYSSSVSFPDRNAMMLIIQFLRNYNKEINMDIEITPEEVLLVQEGLDKTVVNYVSWKVDGEQKRFLEKIVTIRKKLLESLDPDLSGRQPLPIRFLLALEREVHIFLSLVGGKTAFEVMRTALSVYGNPVSQIYALQESSTHMNTLLLHLAAVIRGFGRLGRIADLPLLDEVKARQDQFLGLDEAMNHQALVRRVMGLVDASKATIKSRNNQS